jgi:hypothetical protein
VIEGSAEIGPALSFRPSRAVTVDVKDETGRPCPGVEVMVEGSGRDRQVGNEYAVTDGQGRAVVPGLPGGTAYVHIREVRSTEFSKFPLGKVDLEKGDAFLDAKVPIRTAVEVLARVRIGGAPRLPPRYAVVVRQERDLIQVGPCAEDAAAGTLAFTVRLQHPERAFEVNLLSQFQVGSPPVIPAVAAAGERTGPVEVVIDLAEPASAPVPDAKASAPRTEPALPGESRDQRANRILDTGRATFAFEKTRLEFLLQYLSVSHGLTIVIDGEIERETRGLEITATVRDATLRDALVRVLAGGEDLGFVVRDGVVIVVRK